MKWNEKEISEAIEMSNGFISKSYIKQAEKILSEKQGYSQAPWRVINFGKWMKKFDVSE
jgi:hypothetical protein